MRRGAGGTCRAIAAIFPRLHFGVGFDGKLRRDLELRGERLQLQREVANAVNNRIQLSWNGGQYQLERDPSYSGLPRFEDQVSGLVWIDLPWKGLLLDGRTQKPLANECRAA